MLRNQIHLKECRACFSFNNNNNNKKKNRVWNSTKEKCCPNSKLTRTIRSFLIEGLSVQRVRLFDEVTLFKQHCRDFFYVISEEIFQLRAFGEGVHQKVHKFQGEVLMILFTLEDVLVKAHSTNISSRKSFKGILHFLDYKEMRALVTGRRGGRVNVNSLQFSFFRG